MANKVIVVDVSIYLYKYIGDDTLEVSLMKLISLFQKHSITLIFIFDGKPPAEKKELLQRRRIDKQIAEKKYNDTKDVLICDENGGDAQKVVEKELLMLKKQFIRITRAHIQTAKDIMTSLNVAYIDAPGEADTMCAYMVHSGIAWGCLSDDMDMLVYGCNFVLRNINLSRETVVIYDLVGILSDINVTMTMFREISVISGTDYSSSNKTSLPKTLKLFHKYSVQFHTDKTTELSFYDWLEENTKYIDNRERLTNTYKMFEMSNYPELSKFTTGNYGKHTVSPYTPSLASGLCAVPQN
jgi:5'-3' exonuclease